MLELQVYTTGVVIDNSLKTIKITTTTTDIVKQCC